MLYRRVDLPSKEKVQYVGCYVLKWGKVSEPTVGFVEIEHGKELEKELRYKRVYKSGSKGRICNPIEVTVYWDDGSITKEKLGDLEIGEE